MNSSNVILDQDREHGRFDARDQDSRSKGSHSI